MTKTRDDILRHLPRYYVGNLLFGAIFDAVAEELTLVEEQIDYTARQAFISTASEELARWEKELGIATDETKPLSERRRACIARIIAMDVTNAAKIKAMVDMILEGEDCVVIENFAIYEVGIQFVHTWGWPKEEKEIRRAVEEILPAHLLLYFIYRFNYWSEVLDNLPTWDDVLAWGTWYDVIATKCTP